MLKNYLSDSNQKLARDGILSFGIPAYKSADGSLTCPAALTCIEGCYARNGRYLMPNVKAARERNLELTRLANFPEIIDAEIKRRAPKMVRIHDSGDFYSKAYFADWLHIARLNPTVKFYAYTKMVPLVRSYQAFARLPENLTLILSYGGRFDAQIDPGKDRHSVVFPTKTALTQAGYADVTEFDARASGDNPKIGLVYHGPKAKAWSKTA